MLLIRLFNTAYISKSLTKAASASCDMISSEQPLPSRSRANGYFGSVIMTGISLAEVLLYFSNQYRNWW